MYKIGLSSRILLSNKRNELQINATIWMSLRALVLREALQKRIHAMILFIYITF